MNIRSRLAKLEGKKKHWNPVCVVSNDDETREAAIDRYCAEQEIDEGARDQINWWVIGERESKL